MFYFHNTNWLGKIKSKNLYRLSERLSSMGIMGVQLKALIKSLGTILPWCWRSLRVPLFVLPWHRETLFSTRRRIVVVADGLLIHRLKSLEIKKKFLVHICCQIIKNCAMVDFLCTFVIKIQVLFQYNFFYLSKVWICILRMVINVAILNTVWWRFSCAPLLSKYYTKKAASAVCLFKTNAGVY